MSRNSYQDITLQEFRAMRSEAGAVAVDVREPWEFEEFNEGGVNIPLSEIRQRRSLLEPFETILVICSNGTRSRVAAMDYCRVPEWHSKRIFHLKGGILEAE
ncbi:hypothetical protein GCM10023091_18670 [Ravibacter arvi]|uniref:Rhodanese domain-containing protein n=1 Tax=Ravibacter arvi TaxID=2051041 RepID=A0ABP8LXP0_9BACT